MVGTRVAQLAPALVVDGDLTGSPGLTGVFVALRTVPPLVLPARRRLARPLGPGAS